MSIPFLSGFILSCSEIEVFSGNFIPMKPIIEDIANPEGQSFYAKKFSGKEQCISPGWHIHPEYELVLISQGSGSIYAGSHFSAYHDGLLIFLGPHIPHMPFDNPDNVLSTEVVVQFKSSLPNEGLAQFPEFAAIRELCLRSHSGMVFHSEVQQQVSRQLMTMCDLPKPKQLCSLLEILLQLAETKAYTDLGIMHLSTERENGYQRINQAYDHVAEHFDEEIRIGDIADQLGLTENSFCRFFKRMTQKSFIQFVNEYRINKAVEFMHLSDRKVGEVMYATGFNDPAFFNRQFKKYKGVSPSGYLKRLETRP